MDQTSALDACTAERLERFCKHRTLPIFASFETFADAGVRVGCGHVAQVTLRANTLVCCRSYLRRALEMHCGPCGYVVNLPAAERMLHDEKPPSFFPNIRRVVKEKALVFKKILSRRCAPRGTRRCFTHLRSESVSHATVERAASDPRPARERLRNLFDAPMSDHDHGISVVVRDS